MRNKQETMLSSVLVLSKNHLTLSCYKIPLCPEAGDVAQVDYLPSICKTLDSIPSTLKIKQTIFQE